MLTNHHAKPIKMPPKINHKKLPIRRNMLFLWVENFKRYFTLTLPNKRYAITDLKSSESVRLVYLTYVSHLRYNNAK
jgi:hypothetical protein